MQEIKPNHIPTSTIINRLLFLSVSFSVCAFKAPPHQCSSQTLFNSCVILYCWSIVFCWVFRLFPLLTIRNSTVVTSRDTVLSLFHLISFEYIPRSGMIRSEDLKNFSCPWYIVLNSDFQTRCFDYNFIIGRARKWGQLTCKKPGYRWGEGATFSCWEWLLKGTQLCPALMFPVGKWKVSLTALLPLEEANSCSVMCWL